MLINTIYSANLAQNSNINRNQMLQSVMSPASKGNGCNLGNLKT